jgi:hypothetical protein
MTCSLLAVQKTHDITAGTFPYFAPVAFAAHPFVDMTTIIQNLSDELSAELKTKQDPLDVTQAHLRAAARELAK